MRNLFSVAIELPWVCPQCKQSLILGGVTESILCHSCNNVIETPPAFWAGTLGDAMGYAVDFTDANTMTMSIMGAWGAHSLEYGKVPVHCDPPCQTNISPAALAEGIETGESVECATCTTQLRVRAAPDWFTQAVHPAIVGIAGERHPADAANAADPASLGFHCHGCGAAVPLDGQHRKLQCAYCKTDLMVPDAVWIRLHPAPTLTRWFVLFDADAAPEDDDMIPLRARMRSGRS